MKFQGKVCLVTGGTTGIGLEVARRLAEDGAAVAITGRRSDVGATAQADVTAHAELGSPGCRFLAGDVSVAADAARVVSETIDTFGRLDLAVNNAGIGGQMVRVHEMDEDYFDRVIAVDLKGVWLSMKYQIPPMLDQGGGAIVNIASTAGLKAAPIAGTAYAAAKHGVVGLTRTAAAEYAADGIRINCICPAVIETPLAAESFADPELRAVVEAKHPIGRVGSPEDVASAVVYLGSDTEASFITGVAFPVDGGFLL